MRHPREGGDPFFLVLDNLFTCSELRTKKGAGVATSARLIIAQAVGRPAVSRNRYAAPLPGLAAF